MQKLFRDQLNSLDCLGKNVLAAVSGGLDSVVLLDLLRSSSTLAGIAHANFQLRGPESDGDEAFVRQLAQQHGVPFYSRRFDTNNYATEQGISVQMAARQLRYAWFNALLTDEGFDFLATAHHLNDNLETVLQNFTRGTGLAGLIGIPQKVDKIIRPLLPFTRKEIEAYAKENSLSWREDSSNSHDDYQRNFIRHQVVPRLKELNPSIEETAARNIERLHTVEELAIRELDRLRREYVTILGEQVRIAKVWIRTFQYPGPVLLEFVKGYGFNLEQCIEACLAASGPPGKHFFSPSHQLVIDRNDIIVSPIHPTLEAVRIEGGVNEVAMGARVLKITEGSNGVNADKSVATLDKSKLTFPLIWRKWKHGDSFFPLGMNHHKKISDFLIDNKVSLNEKDEVTVIESGGEIVWVVGYRIDERYKLTDASKGAVVFEVSESQDVKTSATKG